MPAVPQPQRRLRALSARPWPYGPGTNGSLLSCAAHCCNPALRSDRPADRPGPADWPWIDCIADLGPEADSPSLNDLLDRLHARTGRRVASIVRAGAAGLALMASGPYLAWLPMEMLVRLPGRPLCPLPLEFGRRRCPTGLVLRRSAESLAPVRGLRDLIRETANRGARLNPPQRAALPCLDFMSDQLFDGRRIRIPTIVDAFPSSVSKTVRNPRFIVCSRAFRALRRYAPRQGPGGCSSCRSRCRGSPGPRRGHRCR